MTSKNNQSVVRDTILQAALDVICQYHISHTTIRRIAEKASISPSLIHYYFPTKRDLFLSVIDYLNEFYSKNHASYINTDKIRPIEKLMIMVGNQIEYTSRRKEYFVIFDFWTHAINDEEIKSKVKDLFSEWENWINKIITEGIQAGDFDPTNAAIIPYFLISMICGAAIQYLINEQVFDIHDYYDKTYRFITKMLIAPKEISSFDQSPAGILELNH